VRSQRELHDAAVNFDTYRILQRHRAVSLSQHDFLVYISGRLNAEITHFRPSLISMAATQNHGAFCRGVRINRDNRITDANFLCLKAFTPQVSADILVYYLVELVAI